MNIRIRDILLKSIPYLLSIAGGITLFLVTVDNIKNPSVADLITNIAASLLSIPIVFLLYDYSNYRISRKLNQTLASSMSSRITALMLGLVMTLRVIAGIRGKLTLGSLNKMRDISPRRIASKIKMPPALQQKLAAYHTDLGDVIYKYGKNNILDTASMQNLTGITLDLLHMLNEYEFRKDRHAVAKNMVDIFGRIADWMDSDAGAAMNFQKLLQQATDGDVQTAN